MWPGMAMRRGEAAAKVWREERRGVELGEWRVESGESNEE